MIIDMHTHIGIDKDGTRQGIEGLKRMMKGCGVSAAVIFPFNANGNLIKESLNLLKYKSDFIFPFLRFNPKQVTANEVKELLEKNGFVGVKLHPKAQDFDPLDKKYSKIFEEIERSGKPLIVHTRKETTPHSDPDSVVRLAERFPALDIIIGHFADYSAVAIDYIKEHRNLYLETSVFSSNVIIQRVADRIGAEKVVFGSDAPLSDEGIELLKIKKSGLSKSDRDMILFRNAQKLLKLRS